MAKRLVKEIVLREEKRVNKVFMEGIPKIRWLTVEATVTIGEMNKSGMN